jgi:RNA-directed DNA polymerase
MARTFRNLWSRVTSWQNLLRAYQKCRRRKRYRQPATEFHFAWEQNLLQLQTELNCETYTHGSYYHFHITDPKPRKISAAPFRDRVVHHALVGILEPFFEQRFIFDSYACRVGKGTHRAIRRAQHFQRRFPWCLQTDIVKFFPNIDHDILFRIIRKRINDEAVLRLVQKILDSGVHCDSAEGPKEFFAGDDLFSVLRPCGLPIGNLTSQFFANVFLDPVDHFIKETLRVPGYIRYADDLLLFGESRQQMWDIRDRLQERLAEARLRLHPHKTHVQPTRRPVTWLGFQVSPDAIRFSQQGIRRFVRRAARQRKAFQSDDVDLSTIPVSLQAWKAHLRICNSQSLQRTLIQKHLRFRKTETQKSTRAPGLRPGGLEKQSTEDQSPECRDSATESQG